MKEFLDNLLRMLDPSMWCSKRDLTPEEKMEVIRKYEATMTEFDEQWKNEDNKNTKEKS